MNYGFVPSKMDGTEVKFKKIKDFEIPEEYSYIRYLPSVLNQGNKPICVPCSLSAYINWSINTDTGDNKVDNKVNLQEIFDSSSVKSDDGMTFKDGLKFLKHEGVSTKDGVETIDKYAVVGSELALKQALILNGPCVGGLPVYDSRVTKFWSSSMGDYEGGHAIAIVGYNKDGFIIRNSWGKSYGSDGYAVIPYDDFNKFMEIWTIY
jgi:hypothetical protein